MGTHSCLSSSFRLKFMDIIRHVRFSMRSEFGSCAFVRLNSLHICVPNGSFRCISSGLSISASPPVASFQSGKKDSRRTPLRATLSVGERSSLLSIVLEEVSDCIAEDDPEEV